VDAIGQTAQLADGVRCTPRVIAEGRFDSYHASPKRQRWDNPVRMPCGHHITRASGGYLGAHAHDCGADAFYVFVQDGEVVAFRCLVHKESAPPSKTEQK
jgi:hypothetical protein